MHVQNSGIFISHHTWLHSGFESIPDGQKSKVGYEQCLFTTHSHFLLNFSAMKGYRKADQVIQMMAYFGLREWQFENDNIRELYSSLGEEDRKKFEFNFQTIDWKLYFHYYIPGIKRYYMKEDVCVRALQESRKNYNR